jgi:hypothetical protein
MCEHGRTRPNCFECAREVLLDGQSPSAAVRSVESDLAAVFSYVAWLESRLRELEANNRELAAA